MPYPKTNLTLYSSPLEQPRPFSSSENLEHSGVLGMKWGHWNAETVRKYTGGGQQGGKSLSGTFKRGVRVIKKSMANAKESVSKRSAASAEKKKAREIERIKKVNPAKLMSDEELKTRIARLKLEKEYNQLTAEQINKGRRLTKEAIAKGINAGLEAGIKGALTAAISSLGRKQADKKKDKKEEPEAPKPELKYHHPPQVKPMGLGSGSSSSSSSSSSGKKKRRKK